MRKTAGKIIDLSEESPSLRARTAFDVGERMEIRTELQSESKAGTKEEARIETKEEKRTDAEADGEIGEEEESKKKEKIHPLLEFLSWMKYIVVAVLIGLFLSNYVIQRNTVVGSSMKPTLNDNDVLFVEKLSKVFHTIQRGQIVTIHGSFLVGDMSLANEDLVKRVIALPGEHVQIKDGQVYVNNQVLKEDYLPANSYTSAHSFGKSDLLLGENEYYVLGDNRNGSKDSRSFGPVPGEGIVGHVWFRVNPRDRMGAVD